MGDSTCLLHGFSYASAIPNESKQGNAMHALGESISFGRFMTESLSWEKWSSFSSSSSSHKRYVEEAERYAQPGSVAQKKAFFEAHYKRMAAQKAAALLEQQNAAAMAESSEADVDHNAHDQQKGWILESQLDLVEKNEVVRVGDVGEDGGNGNNGMDEDEVCNKEGESVISAEMEGSGESPVKRTSVSGSENSGTPLMEMPLLKHNSAATEDVQSVESKKKSSLYNLKSSIRRKTWKIPSTPARPPVATPTQIKKDIAQSTRKSNVDTADRKRTSSKSLRELISLVPVKEPDKDLVLATNKSVSSAKTPKVCSTPLRTPIVGTSKAATISSANTPLTENRRMKTAADSSAARGSKTMGPKWHILSAVSSKSVTACRNKLQSPSLSTPFTLRTEERAAKRKQKLEEKFNANAMQKVQQQNKLKDRAGNELRKLSCGFCFKARPLPAFYKEIETSVNQIRKTQATTRPQTAVLGRSISNKKQGTVLMPPPPPPPKSTAKKSFSKNPSKNKAANGKKNLTPSLPETPAHENKSPNILQ